MALSLSCFNSWVCCTTPQPVTWGWHADGQASCVPEAHLPLAVVPELQRAERERVGVRGSLSLAMPHL